MSIKDSSTLSRLAYFDEVYLTRHGQFFFFRSRFIYSKSPQVTFSTESRLQVDFKSVLVQVKSVSPNKVIPRSVRSIISATQVRLDIITETKFITYEKVPNCCRTSTSTFMLRSKCLQIVFPFVYRLPLMTVNRTIFTQPGFYLRLINRFSQVSCARFMLASKTAEINYTESQCEWVSNFTTHPRPLSVISGTSLFRQSLALPLTTKTNYEHTIQKHN